MNNRLRDVLQCQNKKRASQYSINQTSSQRFNQFLNEQISQNKDRNPFIENIKTLMNQSLHIVKKGFDIGQKCCQKVFSFTQEKIIQYNQQEQQERLKKLIQHKPNILYKDPIRQQNNYDYIYDQSKIKNPFLDKKSNMENINKKIQLKNKENIAQQNSHIKINKQYIIKLEQVTTQKKLKLQKDDIMNEDKISQKFQKIKKDLLLEFNNEKLKLEYELNMKKAKKLNEIKNTMNEIIKKETQEQFKQQDLEIEKLMNEYSINQQNNYQENIQQKVQNILDNNQKIIQQKLNKMIQQPNLQLEEDDQEEFIKPTPLLTFGNQNCNLKIQNHFNFEQPEEKQDLFIPTSDQKYQPSTLSNLTERNISIERTPVKLKPYFGDKENQINSNIVFQSIQNKNQSVTSQNSRTSQVSFSDQKYFQQQISYQSEENQNQVKVQYGIFKSSKNQQNNYFLSARQTKGFKSQENQENIDQNVLTINQKDDFNKQIHSQFNNNNQNINN